MSISPVVKVAIFGVAARKDGVLRRLQALACLHVVPQDRLEPPAASLVAGARATRPETRRALAFLLASPLRRHPASAQGFDPQVIERRALEIEERLHQLDEAVRRLRLRLRTLEPWGHYALDAQLLAKGLRLWFYAVPHYLVHRIPNQVTAWQVVARDNRHSYVAVLHPDEPEGMPAERDHTGSVSLHDLQQRLQALLAEHDDLLGERVALTRWCEPLAACLTRLEDDAARLWVAQQAWEANGLFALSAWAPEAAMFALRELADETGTALVSYAPDASDAPPTLLHNEGPSLAGQALLGIFLVPGYRAWDPSAWVLLAFALFFGMVMADAGYALVMGGLLLLGRGLDRQRRRGGQGVQDPLQLHALAWLLVTSTGLWGVATGTWFGASASAGSWAGGLMLLNAADFRLMMRVSILTGLTHLVLANLAHARRSGGWDRWAALGWAAVLVGGGLFGFSQGLAWQGRAGTAGLVLAGLGLLLALAAALVQAPGVGGKLGALFNTLMRLPGALGDTLSYLRLFALGYAGAALATAFNDLAVQVMNGVPGFGVLLAMLLLLIGHGMNLVLGVAGGFVHGLRLNFIEFLNWAGIDEGRPFQAFKLKDGPPWTAPQSNSLA